jgi:flagellar FliL protein
MKLPVLIVVVLLASLLGGGLVAAGGYFLVMPGLRAELGLPEKQEEAGQASEEAAVDPEELPLGEGEPLYFEFARPLLITLDSQADAKFLQLAFTVLVRHQALIDKMTAREAELRNDLIIRLGAESPDTLRTPQGREELRQNILSAFQDRLGFYIDEEAELRFVIEDILLTNLVMQ